MSMWRAGSHECEPVSFHAIPLRYSIGQGHPVVDTCPVHEGRFCHQSGVSGFPHAGQFHWIHAMAVDSKGNVYTAEVDTGKRVQKFKLTSDALR